MGQIFQGFSTNSFKSSYKHNCYLNGKLPYILKHQWCWKPTYTLKGIATYLLNFVHISLPTIPYPKLEYFRSNLSIFSKVKLLRLWVMWIGLSIYYQLWITQLHIPSEEDRVKYSILLFEIWESWHLKPPDTIFI